MCQAAHRQFLSQFITKAAAVAGGEPTFDVFLLETPGGWGSSSEQPLGPEVKARPAKEPLWDGDLWPSETASLEDVTAAPAAVLSQKSFSLLEICCWRRC